MKQPFLIPVLLVLTATLASAEGINLSWEDCGAAGQSSRSFACDVNEGQDVLVASVQLPVDMDTVCAFNAYVDMSSNSPVLPDWWEARSPYDFFPDPNPPCRDTVGVRVAFNPSGVSCPAIFTPQGIPEVPSGVYYSMQRFVHGPNRLRIVLSVLRSAVPLNPAAEHYAFSIVVNRAMTTGQDACGGCDVSMCIVLNEIEVGSGTRCDPVRITNPISRSFVTWQAASVDGCPLSTPTNRSTWGAVRSLYR